MRKVTNINSLWAFRKTEVPPSSFDRNWDLVSLPHTWNNIDGIDGGNDYWRGKAGGKPGLTVEPPLTVENPEGGYSDEMKMIYHLV